MERRRNAPQSPIYSNVCTLTRLRARGGAGDHAGLRGDQFRLKHAAAADAVDDATDRGRRYPVEAGIHGGQLTICPETGRQRMGKGLC